MCLRIPHKSYIFNTFSTAISMYLIAQQIFYDKNRSYLRSGHNEDLLFLGIIINSKIKYTIVQLFITFVELVDFLLFTLSPDDVISLEDANICELIDKSKGILPNIKLFVSFTKFFLMIGAPMSQIDIGITNIICNHVGMFLKFYWYSKI